MSRRTGAVGVVAALLLLTGCSRAEPSSDPELSPSRDVESVDLVAAAQPTGRCALPTAEALAGEDVAFEGTVTSLREGRASLEVDRWFTDGTGDLVTVAAPTQALRDLLVAVHFEVGETYLVSATDGRVSLCGFSGRSTPELTEIYEKAFAAE